MTENYPHDVYLEAHHDGPIRTPDQAREWLDFAAENRTRRGGYMDLSEPILCRLRALHSRIRHGKFDSNFWSRIGEIAQLDHDLNLSDGGRAINNFPSSMILGALFPLLDSLTAGQSERRFDLATTYFEVGAFYDWYYHFLLVSTPEYLELLDEIRKLNAITWEDCRAQLCQTFALTEIEADQFKTISYRPHHVPDPLYPPPEFTLRSYLREYLTEDYYKRSYGGSEYRLSLRLCKIPRRGRSTLCPRCGLYVQGLYAAKGVCFECWDG